MWIILNYFNRSCSRQKPDHQNIQQLLLTMDGLLCEVMLLGYSLDNNFIYMGRMLSILIFDITCPTILIFYAFLGNVLVNIIENREYMF